MKYATFGERIHQLRSQRPSMGPKLEARSSQTHAGAALQRFTHGPGQVKRPGDVLQLQSALGNRAVGRLAARGGSDLVQRHQTEVKAINLQLERPSPNDMMKLMGLHVKYAS